MKKLSKKLRMLVLLIAAAMVFVFSPMANAREQQESSEACDGLFRSYTCQALDNMLDFIGGFYETVVERNLVVNPELFSSNYDGSTGHALREAWRTFRNLANLMLLVGLILIILSQITGIGISNYGVKKGLPKLVVMVLLVNLSYIICQGCIDLANILGATIGDFFEDLLAKSIPTSVDIHLGSTYLTSIMLAFGTVVFIKMKAFTTKILIGAILLLFLILLAMFMLYVVLAIRQSLCILLVITSPVAFCCALVPGTKKVFDFWLETMKSVLFAYPVCSFIVYGGAVAGSVVYLSWEAAGSVVAPIRSLGFLLISVIPYFFIPKIILKGLSVMEGTFMQIRNFAKKNGRGLLESSLLMQSLRTQDKRMREIHKAGLRVQKDENGNRRLVSRFGYKGYSPKKLNENATKGPFKGIRNGIAGAYNSGVKKVSKNKVFANVSTGDNRFGRFAQRYYANAHKHSATSAYNAMQKMGRFRLKPDKSTWLEYDQNGKLVRRTSTGRVSSFYTSRTKPGDAPVDGSTAIGKMRVAFHNAVGARFMNSQFKVMGAKVRTPILDDAGNALGYKPEKDKQQGTVVNANGEEVALEEQLKGYMQEVEQAASRAEAAAFGARLKTDLDAGFDSKWKDLQTYIQTNSVIQAKAMFNKLMDEGEAGRNALERIIDDEYPNVSTNLKTFLDSLTSAEIDRLKKKNPQLHNKIKKIRETSEARAANGRIAIMNPDSNLTAKDMYGMSAKQFADMDHGSQNRLAEQLVNTIENDPGAVNNPEVIAAITMAEGALYDPDIRSSLSAEALANLENIANLRHAAVENAFNVTVTKDSSNIRTAIGTTTISDPNFEQKFVDAMRNAFVGNAHADSFTDAITNGDTVRMEGIMKAIDKELDTIMNQSGIVDTNERAVRRNTIMRKVIQGLCDGYIAGTDSNNNPIYKGGLFTDDSNRTVKNSGPQAEAIKRARDAETMLEQRYARRMANG